ncbi:MAG: hypothetical protein ACM339_15120 [Ignavibacteria bacterium]
MLQEKEYGIATIYKGDPVTEVTIRYNAGSLSSAVQIIITFTEMFQSRGFNIVNETSSQVTLQRYGKTIDLYYEAKFSSYDVIINAKAKE